MSIPAFAWAMERGREHDLTPAERLVLIYLADKANGIRECWPSQQTIRDFTGLALRTIREVLPRLAERGLIRIVAKIGCATHYHILRATDQPRQNVPRSEPRQNVPTTPANGDGVKRVDPGKWCIEPRQMVRLTPAKCTPEPLSEPLSEPKRDVFFSGQRKEPPREAPEPEPTPEEVMANRQRQLDELAAASPDVAMVVARLGKAMGTNVRFPLGSKALRSPSEQRDEVAPRWKPVALTPEQLAMARAGRVFA